MKNKVHQYDLLEERIKNIISNIAHQEIENERRLEGLNHENERIQEILKLSIPREVFERAVSELRSLIQILTDWRNSELGKSQWKQWIPYIIAIAAIIFAYIKK